MDYSKLLKKDLRILLHKRDVEIAQLRADKERLLREQAPQMQGNSIIPARPNIGDMGKLAQQYCKEHNVRSVSVDQLRAYVRGQQA